MTKRQLIITEEMVNLLDQRKHAMEVFREENGSNYLSLTMRRNLIEHLYDWADSQYKRIGNNTGTDAAIALAIFADDIAEKWEQSIEVTPEKLDRLDDLWLELIESIGSASYLELEKEKVNSTTYGRSGGKNDKKRQWAIALADYLANEYGRMKKSHALQNIPESSASLELELKDGDYRVFKDGNKVMAFNKETLKEEDMTLETFWTEYFREKMK